MDQHEAKSSVQSAMNSWTPLSRGLATVALVLLLLNLSLLLQPRGLPVTATNGASQQALLMELRLLRESQAGNTLALERLESIWLESSAPAAERSALLQGHAPDSLPNFEALLGKLASLTQAVEQQGLQSQALLQQAIEQTTTKESLFQLNHRRESVNWAALDELLLSWESNEEAASRSQYFQTPRELLELYGPPTAIYNPTRGTLYHYRKFPAGTPGPNWYFRVKEGSVIEFWVEMKNGEDG